MKLGASKIEREVSMSTSRSAVPVKVGVSKTSTVSNTLASSLRNSRRTRCAWT
jgi:hypothetical protein